MAREFTRIDRLGDQVRRELSQLIQRELKDPRIGMVSVTAVVVSRDMGHARVYFSVLDEAEAEATCKVLQNASGFLRHNLMKQIKIRVMPQLRFYYDNSTSRGSELSALIDSALAEDRLHPGAED